MPTELIVALVIAGISALGTVGWTWINSIEKRIANLNEAIHNLEPTIHDHVLRLDENDRNTNKLIHKVVQLEEQVTHSVQILNRGYYRLSAMENTLSEFKKSLPKYRDTLKSQEQENE